MAEILDAGIFVIMLGVGLGTFFMGRFVKYGFIFKLLGAFLFFSLGIMMVAEYEVAYAIITDDGNSTTAPETQYIYLIGDGSGEASNASWIGWLFIGLGLIWVGFFFIEIMSMMGWSY